MYPTEWITAPQTQGTGGGGRGRRRRNYGGNKPWRGTGQHPRRRPQRQRRGRQQPPGAKTTATTVG
jgi:hypothetical protein